MNNLIVCSPQLGIAPESNSGGEVYDREVINALCDQGIKVIVILPKNKPYMPHKNLKVYYLPIPFIWPPYLFNLLIIPYLFWIYKKEKFNIIRVHSPYFVGIGAFIFKLFFSNILLEAHYHHLEENKSIFHLINKILIYKWDVITVDSKFTKEEIEVKYGINKNKIKIIYAGVDNKFQTQVKNQKLINKYQLGNKKVLLFLGGLKPRKNINFLLNLIKTLNLTNVKLLICGSGELEKQLKDRAEELNIKDNVIFTGFIKEKEKVDYYNLADIFLFPSIKEGFGMPVIEAAACGVPVITSDISSLKELIIDGKTGYLAKFNDFQDWKNKIEYLFQNNIIRKKMGSEALKFSYKFSWKISAISQINIYKKLLK